MIIVRRSFFFQTRKNATYHVLSCEDNCFIKVEKDRHRCSPLPYTIELSGWANYGPWVDLHIDTFYFFLSKTDMLQLPLLWCTYKYSLNKVRIVVTNYEKRGIITNFSRPAKFAALCRKTHIWRCFFLICLCGKYLVSRTWRWNGWHDFSKIEVKVSGFVNYSITVIFVSV